jgi:LPXTG-motif cell wall-anchored protein
MRELVSFHAAQRGFDSSCGSGCGCGPCGEYAGDYGSKYWGPGGMPDWNYDWYGRAGYRAGSCPDYEKAVKDYLKAAAQYDGLPRTAGLLWGANEDKSKTIIAKAKEAKSRGKAALRECKMLKKKGEGKYEETSAGIEAGRGGAAASTSEADKEYQAALEKVSAAGGTEGSSGGSSNTTLLIIGGIAVVGLGALFVLRKKPAKRASSTYGAV